MIQGYTLFWIFQKGSGTSFYSTFCAIFFKKNISCYILLTDQISFSDCLYFSKYLAMYIVNVSFPVCDIKNFEIYLSFLINRFPTWPRSQNKISKLETALGAIKSIFYHFQKYSTARNVLKSESAPLIKCRRGCFSILLIFFILRQLPMNLSLLISNIYIYMLSNWLYLNNVYIWIIFVFSAFPCWWKVLRICNESFWIRVDFLLTYSITWIFHSQLKAGIPTPLQGINKMNTHTHTHMHTYLISFFDCP